MVLILVLFAIVCDTVQCDSECIMSLVLKKA